MDGASALSISAAKLPVAGLRRQAAVGVENFYPMIYCARRREFAVCADDDSGTRRCCGIVWRLPQKPQSPSESARLANGKYHRPFGVVSKCALREKKEEGPRFPGDLPSEI